MTARNSLPIGEYEDPLPTFSYCYDCSDHNDYKYMVKNWVWRLACKGERIKFLCLVCLALRLGRKLKITDFIPGLPINRSFFLAYEMGLLDGKT